MTTATVAPQAEVQKVSFGYHLKLWVLSFLKYFSLVFITFWILLPLVTCFFTAAKGTDEWRSTSVMTFPKNIFNFENYAEAFKLSNMGIAFRNSVIVLVCVCFLTTIIGTQLAYVLSRFQFPGNALIRTAFMMAALLPGIAMSMTTIALWTRDGHLPPDQLAVGLHHHVDGHRRDLDLHLHPVFRESVDLPR